MVNVYSNAGFGLLGSLLARAADETYAELIEARIFVPLAMASATVGDWSSEQRAVPLLRDGREAAYWNFDALAGAGAARGSIGDALHFLKASVAACQLSTVLARDNCRAQQGTGVKIDVQHEQGLGWIRRESTAGDIVWHNGGTGGFSSFLGFNTQTGKGLVVLANVADLAEVTNLSLNFLSQ